METNNFEKEIKNNEKKMEIFLLKLYGKTTKLSEIINSQLKIYNDKNIQINRDLLQKLIISQIQSELNSKKNRIYVKPNHDKSDYIIGLTEKGINFAWSKMEEFKQNKIEKYIDYLRKWKDYDTFAMEKYLDFLSKVILSNLDILIFLIDYRNAMNIISFISKLKNKNINESKEYATNLLNNLIKLKIIEAKTNDENVQIFKTTELALPLIKDSYAIKFPSKTSIQKYIFMIISFIVSVLSYLFLKDQMISLMPIISIAILFISIYLENLIKPKLQKLKIAKQIKNQ